MRSRRSFIPLAMAFAALASPGLTQQPQIVSIKLMSKLADETLIVKKTPILEVAVLSNFAFDAIKSVDEKTVSFAGSGALARNGGSRTHHLCAERDANGDGLEDLVCAFETKKLQLEPDRQNVQLTGKMHDGRPFAGEATLYVVKD